MLYLVYHRYFFATPFLFFFSSILSLHCDKRSIDTIDDVLFDTLQVTPFDSVTSVNDTSCHSWLSIIVSVDLALSCDTSKQER